MTFHSPTYQAALSTAWLGRTLEHHATIPSTNAHLKERARAGQAPEVGTVVLADAQTAGYGQQGRSWASEPGRGLYLSLWLPRELATRPVTLMAGVAAVDALRAQLESDAIGIKWVNDLVALGRKLGGILAEVVHAPAGSATTSGLVLGLGLNLVPPEMSEAIALSDLGSVPSREQLLAALMNHLEIWMEASDAALCDQWRAYAVTLGQQVRAQLPAEVLEGFAEGIDDTGALLLRLSDGRIRAIASGSIRLADGRYC